MKRLDVNLINLFSTYHVWEESNRFYFETDYALKYFVDFTLEVNRSAIILRPLRLKEKSPEQKSMSLSLLHEIIRKP